MNPRFRRAEFDPAPGFPPNAMLVTGPVGCGKTELAVEAILDSRSLSAFNPIWVLLASQQQMHAFRRRLIARSMDTVQFGVEFFDFTQLYRRVLDLYGDPQRLIDDTTRYQILRQCIADLRERGELPFFEPVADRPGFIGLVAGLIHELKQGLVWPEVYAEVAASRGDKDRELARIYDAYQRFLQDRFLVDRHGAGWLAIEHLEREPLPAPVKLLVVDGFDQFSAVHARFLVLLAHQVESTLVTLTAMEGEAARRFHRFERTRARLLQIAQEVGEGHRWEVRKLDRTEIPPSGQRHPALDHLLHNVFQSEPQPVEPGDALAMIEAPDVGREVQAVLRRVKRLLLEGVSPEAIVIVARDLWRYSDALRETACTYGLPLVVHARLPLRENPAVALLLRVLDLAQSDFPRRDVLDILRSPYLRPPGLTAEDIGWLERISQERQIVRGRAVWLEEFEGSWARGTFDEDGEPLDLPSPDDLARLRAALDAYFERVTPPPEGTVYDFVTWITDWMGADPAAQLLDRAEGLAEESPDEAASVEDNSLGVIACARAATDAERVTRDVLALQSFMRVLAGLRAAHDLAAGDGELPVMDWHQFRAELQLAVEQEQLVPPGGLSRIGRVLAADALDVRGLPHDHVFVMGLVEGVFPARLVDQGLYHEHERRKLEEAGIAMQSIAERADDLSLFVQVMGLARRQLTLSRFTITDKGTPAPASPFWRAVAAIVPNAPVERVPIGGIPALDVAATLGEVALAVAAQFSGEQGDDTAVTMWGAYNALLESPQWGGSWRAVLRGRAIEVRREDAHQPFDRFAGILTDATLVHHVAHQLGPERIWSASQLNEYGICPFRFFARRVLKLEEIVEPEVGMDALQYGSVVHAVLEETYRAIQRERLAIVPENVERALTLLHDAAADVLATAPQRWGFRASAVWEYEQQDMLRRLERLVEQDFSDPDKPWPNLSATDGRHPLALEERFGFKGVSPLAIDGPAGPLAVRGVIDRLDRAGDAVIVIDYKTGSTPRRVDDMAEGREFQMAIYLLAAQQLLAEETLTPVGGVYWHTRSGDTSGEVPAEHPALAQAIDHMHRHVLRARDGFFEVHPAKPQKQFCRNYCEFRRLCRVTPAAPRKAQASVAVHGYQTGESHDEL